MKSKIIFAIGALLLLLAAIGLSTARAQTAGTYGPSYIAGAQAMQIANTATLTAPVLTAFPVTAYLSMDGGTIDGSGNQTVLSTTQLAQIQFDMLDAAHASVVVSCVYGGVTYSAPMGAVVNLFGAAVALQQQPPAASAKLNVSVKAPAPAK